MACDATGLWIDEANNVMQNIRNRPLVPSPLRDPKILVIYDPDDDGGGKPTNGATGKDFERVAKFMEKNWKATVLPATNWAEAMKKVNEITTANGRFNLVIIVDHSATANSGPLEAPIFVESDSFQMLGDDRLSVTQLSELQSHIVETGGIMLGGCFVGLNEPYVNNLMKRTNRKVISSPVVVEYHSFIDTVFSSDLPFQPRGDEWKITPSPNSP